ncbi:hypothetical protein E4U56_004194 [Claviceps arundinis]|uniref:Uncharacterized protein n=1 Tax=Claviceps arundinis TaxID=1623583 RepID=A0A9P7MM21_9HYPO|nr:hypothetical protein E4U56_004194 [Claviceps arundinis]
MLQTFTNTVSMRSYARSAQGETRSSSSSIMIHVKMNSSSARPATEATASASRAAEDTTTVQVEETSTTNSPFVKRYNRRPPNKRRLEHLDEQDANERDDGPITSRPFLHHQAQLRVQRQLVVALTRLLELLVQALPGRFIDRDERVVLD